MPQAWQFLISPLKSHWQALRAAREKAALAGDQISESSILVRAARIELASSEPESGILSIELRVLRKISFGMKFYSTAKLLNLV